MTRQDWEQLIEEARAFFSRLSVIGTRAFLNTNDTYVLLDLGRSLSDALVAAGQRCETLEAALRNADDLLRRFSEWDMLNSYVGPDGNRHYVTADAPYWQGEIAKTREALAGSPDGPPEANP